MNRRKLFACALLFSPFAGLSCADNNSSLLIKGVLAPPTVQGTSTCTYSSDQPLLSSGVLDVALASDYRVSLSLGNQLIATQSGERGKVETSRINVQGITVRVTNNRGVEVVSPFTRLGSTFVDPSKQTDPAGAVLVGMEVIDSRIVGRERARLATLPRGSEIPRYVVYIRAFGQTAGGTRVESGEFQFPIDICYGCLVNFPREAIDPAQPAPNCGKATSDSSGGGAQITSPCVMGQDQVVDCRLCSANPVCQK